MLCALCMAVHYGQGSMVYIFYDNKSNISPGKSFFDEVNAIRCMCKRYGTMFRRSVEDAYFFQQIFGNGPDDFDDRAITHMEDDTSTPVEVLSQPKAQESSGQFRDNLLFMASCSAISHYACTMTDIFNTICFFQK